MYLLKIVVGKLIHCLGYKKYKYKNNLFGILMILNVLEIILLQVKNHIIKKVWNLVRNRWYATGRVDVINIFLVQLSVIIGSSRKTIIRRKKKLISEIVLIIFRVF